MKGALLLALVAPTLAFVPVNKPVMPMAKVHSRKTAMQMSDSMAPLPGLASTPGQPTVEMWLMDNADKKLSKAVLALFASCKEIAYKIRTASCDKMACFNEFGDEQLAIDILANNVLFQNLKDSGVVATASSEETPTEDPMGGDGYSVAFDPLDGSSIIDTNFAVGTIFGVWPGSRLTGIKGRELAASGIATYGPRTTISIAINSAEGAHEFLLVDDFTARHGMWVKTNTFTTIGEGKLFAPGNLRAIADNPGYNSLHKYWLDNKYQLRYTGGMVPDVNQMLVKGKGVFVNPESPSAKAKLRLLYEVAPIGFLVEKAGGKSSYGAGSVLDLKVYTTEDRTQVAYGSPDEVKRFEDMVGIKYSTAHPDVVAQNKAHA